jgi:hypothetical protein
MPRFYHPKLPNLAIYLVMSSDFSEIQCITLTLGHYRWPHM